MWRRRWIATIWSIWPVRIVSRLGLVELLPVVAVIRTQICFVVRLTLVVMVTAARRARMGARAASSEVYVGNAEVDQVTQGLTRNQKK